MAIGKLDLQGGRRTAGNTARPRNRDSRTYSVGGEDGKCRSTTVVDHHCITRALASLMHLHSTVSWNSWGRILLQHHRICGNKAKLGTRCSFRQSKPWAINVGKRAVDMVFSMCRKLVLRYRMRQPWGRRSWLQFGELHRRQGRKGRPILPRQQAMRNMNHGRAGDPSTPPVC